MLLLSRKKNEKVVLVIEESGEKTSGGIEITLQVVKIKNGQVRLGFEAPKNVSIWRNELYEEICKEKNKKRENG